jgi:2-methylisocitrate lyase-like PEP mutase family enzyme
LERPGALKVASAYDGLVARVMESEGFEALMLSGNSTSTALGMVDVGLTTMTEVADHLHHITHAVDVPVLVDADTGYGGVLNVQRTVREMERAGAAGIMLEDQAFPKRSGLGGEQLVDESRHRLTAGKSVVSVRDAVNRVRAAIDARTDPATVIVARTDARTVEGFHPALERAQAYAKAGADLIYIEGLQSLDELRQAGQVAEAPLLINDAIAGQPLTAEQAQVSGCKIIVFSAAPTAAIFRAVRDLARHVIRHGTIAGYEDRLVPRAEIDAVVRLDATLAAAESYS